MAQSVTGVLEAIDDKQEKLTLTWQSAADGSVSQAIGGLDYSWLNRLRGMYLVKMVTDPSGTAAPTDDYDVTLLDDDGLDVLGGAGADRDTANSEVAHPTPDGTNINLDIAGPVDGDLDLTIANAGDTKAGVVKLYFRSLS